MREVNIIDIGGNNHKSRQLPHNVEAEQGLLGALLIDNRAIDRAGDFLEPQHFFTPAHQRIFEAIRKVIERGQTASPVTLRNYFEKDGDLEHVGGGEYLADLAAATVGVFNVPDYARTIYDLHLRRELIACAEDTAAQAYEPRLDRTALQTLEAAEERLYRISGSRHSSPEARPIIEGIQDALTVAARNHPRSCSQSKAFSAHIK